MQRDIGRQSASHCALYPRFSIHREVELKLFDEICDPVQFINLSLAMAGGGRRLARLVAIGDQVASSSVVHSRIGPDGSRISC